MTPNWFEDGKNIETLVGGAAVIGLQVFNSWRSIRNGNRIESVRSLVTLNDAQILADLSTAQNSLNAVRSQLGGDRRRASVPGAPSTFAGVGRRATDPPAEP